jgi:hypothetical protein
MIFYLSYENWGNIFALDNVNNMFSSFLDSYLNIFYSSFPLKRVLIANKSYNKWITPGILISCKRKRELFLAYRNSSNLDLINYYKKYCSILSAVINPLKPSDYYIYQLL